MFKVKEGLQLNTFEQTITPGSDGFWFGNTTWINHTTSNYNGYNENIRLVSAPGSGASVIAFSTSGESGIPTTSILGYSDRLEFRFGSTWQQRIYNGSVYAQYTFRAPIFQDSNDTAYYGDFSNPSTSISTRGQIVASVNQDTWAFRATTATSGINHSGLWFTGDVANILLRDATGTITTRLSADGSTANNKIGGNSIFHDGYHPNADTWTTARTNTVTLTGDVSGSGSASVNGSGNWTVSISTAVADNSHGHDWVTTTPLTSADDLNTVTANGSYRWTSSQPANNVLGTYNNLFVQSDGGQPTQMVWGGSGGTHGIAIRRRDSGVWQSWNRFFADNYHPNADKWTTARTNTVTLTGDVSGTGSASVDGSGNWTVSVGTDLSISSTDTFTGTYPIAWLATDNLYKSSWFTIDGANDRLSVPQISSDIVYDRNNTGYYVDPASTSNINILNVADINRDPTVTLSGDVTGSATMTNLGSINIATTVANDSHSHSNYVLKTGDTMTGTLNYRTLQNQQTSNYDTAGDSSGFSVFYGTSSATSKPSGTDHAVITLSYSTAWQVQEAADWRTNARYIRKQENGTWSSWQRIFADDYHPNADKWTTARTNTVTLTGDATGTGSASVDGSGNWTVSINTTVANDSHTHSNYVLKTGDTMTGDLTISKTSPLIRLYDSNNSTGSFPAIEFDTTNNQGIAITFNEFDGELPAAGYGLVVGPSSTNAQFPTTGDISFSVLGEIYTGTEDLSTLHKVWHAGNFNPSNYLTTAAYVDDYVSSASFNTGNGILTLTRAEGGTVTVDLDGRYLTSETDSQTLSWNGGTGELSISNGNTVDLDGRYLEVAGDTVTGTLEHTYGGVTWSHNEAVNRPVSIKTHDQANNVGTTGSVYTDVYGEADLGAIDNDETFTYSAAWAALEIAGARMPTLSELFDGVGSGSGQGYDSEFLWTCTQAGPTHYFVAKGNISNNPPVLGTDYKIVDITDPAEVYRTRGFFDVSHANRQVNYASDSEIYIKSNKAFHDGYHPNADKWTTARTNTVTLTGDATGTGSASVDGSGNWTVSISTAVANDSHSHSNYVIKTGDTMTGTLTNTVDVRSPIFYDSNNTSYYGNFASTSRMNSVYANQVYLAANDSYRFRFWGGSDNYAIGMSTAGNSTYGGRAPGETTSDYNMYFTMSGGTNRGFVFRNTNAASGAVAGIDASGTGYFPQLRFGGHNPAVEYNFDGDGVVSTADALAYLKFGSGVTTGTNLSAVETISPNWSAISGIGYTDNKFRIMSARGSSEDALRRAVSTSVVGEGDTTIIGNVNIDGTSTRLVAGIGISGLDVYVVGDLIGSGDITAYSDERLKENIETLDGSKVYEMRGVSFTKDGKAGSGVVAQELEQVAPELVHDSGEYKSVAYGNLVGYLIEAVKDLKAEVDDLKSQLSQKEI